MRRTDGGLRWESIWFSSALWPKDAERNDVIGGPPLAAWVKDPFPEADAGHELLYDEMGTGPA